MRECESRRERECVDVPPTSPSLNRCKKTSPSHPRGCGNQSPRNEQDIGSCTKCTTGRVPTAGRANHEVQRKSIHARLGNPDPFPWIVPRVHGTNQLKRHFFFFFFFFLPNQFNPSIPAMNVIYVYVQFREQWHCQATVHLILQHNNHIIPAHNSLHNTTQYVLRLSE